MNDTLTLSRRAGRLRRSEHVATVVAVALFAMLALMAAPVLDTPDMVEQLEIANGSDWPAEVAVSADGRTGWVVLGSVAPQGETTFAEVSDPGPTWVVRYRYAGVEVLHEVARDLLDSRGWRLSVPADFGKMMRRAGVPGSPPRGS